MGVAKFCKQTHVLLSTSSSEKTAVALFEAVSSGVCWWRQVLVASGSMGKSRKNFYAVRVGRNTGIYKSW